MKDDSTNAYKLQPLIVTANRFNTKQIESATKTIIIDAKKIEVTNGNRFSDLLTTVPSISIKSYGQSPALQTLSLNGLGAEHTLILIDGVRLNSFQNSQIDLSLIPKEIIEKIEIVNSGSSSLYGSDAIGGVINIITKKGDFSTLDNKIGASIKYSYGSYRTKNYGLKLSSKLGNLSSNVFYSRQYSDGNFKYIFHKGGSSKAKERENSAYDNWDTGINLSLICSEKSYLNLFTTYTDQDKEIPGIETGNKAPSTKQRDRNLNSILKYENLISDNSNIKLSFNYQNNLMNYSALPFTKNQYKNLVYSASVQYSYSFNLGTINGAYEFTNAELRSKQLEGNPIRNINALSTGAELSLPANVKLFPSIRFENISDIDSNVVTGKLGINWQPVPTLPFHIRGNFGNNFRAPSFNDLYWRGSGNPNLLPESSNNLELGAVYKISTSSKIELSYVQINAKNKIVWSPKSNGLWTPQNIAESKSKIYSFNFSNQLKINDLISVVTDGGVVFNSSKKTSANYPGDPSLNKQIIYIPKNSIKINSVLNIYNFSIGLFYQHNDTRFTDFQNKRPLAANNIVNTNLLYKFSYSKITLKLNLEINNLFNADYQVVAGYPMPLRNYLFNISINY